MSSSRLRAGLLSLAVPTVVVLCWSTYAFSQAPFYQGKTLTILAASPAGGSGDLRIKAAVPFLRKHIPGNPTIVIDYMPGGGGRKLANHLFRNAHPDGLTMGSPGSGFAAEAILGEAGVQYDIDKFIYLGTSDTGVNYVFHTAKAAGLDTLEKLRAAPGVRIGAQSIGHDTYNRARMFAWLLGLKEPKFIVGYGGLEHVAAIAQGEIDALAYPTNTILVRSPDWLENGNMHFHAIWRIPKDFRIPHPVFDNLPPIESFVKTESERKVVLLHYNLRYIGYPYILPARTPKERVKILSDAMRKTFRDPDFAVNLKKLIGIEPDPLFAEEQTKVISEIPRDPQAIEIYRKLIGGGALPPR
jgi:tripartite-type tricarboxylate transporter receptor subunit TctC